MRKLDRAAKTGLVVSVLRADERVVSVQADLVAGRITVEVREAMGKPPNTIVLTVRSR